MNMHTENKHIKRTQKIEIKPTSCYLNDILFLYPKPHQFWSTRIIYASENKSRFVSVSFNSKSCSQEIPIAESRYSVSSSWSESVPENHEDIQLAAWDILSNSHLCMNLASIASEVSVCKGHENQNIATLAWSSKQKMKHVHREHYLKLI